MLHERSERGKQGDQGAISPRWVAGGVGAGVRVGLGGAEAGGPLPQPPVWRRPESHRGGARAALS